MRRLTLSLFGREVFNLEAERRDENPQDGPVVDSRHNGLFERAEQPFGYEGDQKR